MREDHLVALERFWLPVGMSYSLTSAGWLNDPSAEGLWRANVEAVSTESLADRRCVVLLGEPGMGKTSALAAGKAMLPPGETVEELHVDLGVYASEDRLVRDVFEGERVRAWKSGSRSLCLTLDGFDEALSRVTTLARLLAGYLASWDCGRLFFRLVCRTADWPQTMRSVLEDSFGEANIHELLPLRRWDAGLLVGAAGLDAEEVLAAAERARIVPLAARPLTLRLIQAAIDSDGSLPDRAGALYERGLKALLDEMNRERRGSIRPPGGVALRMRAAERIAALSLFCGRPTLWTGPVVEANADDLTVDECVAAPGKELNGISSEDVDATLRSGVFTGAGESRLTWSHATFMDFLAAKWIVNEHLDDDQVWSLLVANDGRIHARVRQVAAWLVGLAPERFRHLIQQDPQAFLASADLPEETLRAEVVSGLLEDAQSGGVFDESGVDYSGLKHSGLAEQLRPALQTARGEACRVALRIARQCSTPESVPDLTALALNEDADPHLRASAAMAVHDLSAAAPSHDLVTIIGSSAGRPSDVEAQELEAAALMASWPHAVSTESVFSVLSPSHPSNYFGLYSMFVDHFAKGLRDDDLGAACAWIQADLSRVDDPRSTTLTNAILRLCLSNLDQQPARAVVTAVAFRRLDNDEAPFEALGSRGEAFELDADTRRAVTLLLLANASEEQVWGMVDRSPGAGGALARDEDLAWLLDVYATSSGATRENAGRAAKAMLNPGLAAHANIVLGLADDHPASAMFAYWRSTVDLRSDEAREVRDQRRELTQRRRQRGRDRADEQQGDEWVNPQIAEDISKAAAGDASAFWYAARLVTVRPGTRQYVDEYQPDLTLHPRWETLPESVRSEFVIAARNYVENGECQPDLWFGQNRRSFLAEAGYRALILLLRLAPAALDSVSPAAWRKWAPILIDWTATTNGVSEEDKRRLLALARPHADDELRAAMLALVDKAIADGSHVFLRTEFEALSSESLGRELAERLASPMTADTRRTVMNFLLERHFDLVAPVLCSWLGQAERAEDPDRAMEAADRLLRFHAASSWAQLKDLMSDDAPFMEAALLTGAQNFNRQAPDLAPQDLADLYLWLWDHFPAAEDPKFDGTHWVSPREALGTWRDALLSALSRIGTRDAVAAIERILRQRPDEAWLARVLSDAKRAQRERSWEPLTPDEVDHLARSLRARIVRSDADLHTATLRALDEIQARLQADTPSANLLWDTHAKRPKSEEEISDYLAIELEQRLNARGVVVNREVQVRRTKPSGLPERTDLRVEAIPTGQDRMRSPGTLRIPGEVKGSWNAEVIESLETQLVQRYMADFQTDHGVYVVAWFDQESWIASDGRRSRAASHGRLADITAALEAEAEKQRDRGLVVAVRVLDCSLKRPTVT